MTTYRVLHTDSRPPTVVEADHVEQHGEQWVFYRDQLVLNRPRSVVTLRLPVAEVQQVTLG